MLDAKHTKLNEDDRMIVKLVQDVAADKWSEVRKRILDLQPESVLKEKIAKLRAADTVLSKNEEERTLAEIAGIERTIGYMVGDSCDDDMLSVSDFFSDKGRGGPARNHRGDTQTLENDQEKSKRLHRRPRREGDRRGSDRQGQSGADDTGRIH